MRMFLISDNVDTQTGMRLAGVDGVVVHTEEELKNALDAAIADTRNDILLLTEKFGKDYTELVNGVKARTLRPLIIDIPDRHGTGRSPNFITDYVNQSIGLKL